MSARCLVSLLIVLSVARGFLVAPSQTSGASLVSLYASKVDKSIDDLEKARDSFEALIGPQIFRHNDDDEDKEYVPPPLTTSSRKRRELEIKMLESLYDSDEAVDELMHLWLHERDAASAQTLVAMEERVSPGMIQEEEDLLDMVDDYGLDWPEPAARLATLLYYKGRPHESYEWANKVLRVKPWHFEVVNVQIGNCVSMDSKEEVWKWARKALPPLNEYSNNSKRKKWVMQAVRDARRQLEEAERSARGESEVSESVWQ